MPHTVPKRPKSGDTVEIRDGLVFINGRQLDEPYIYTEDDGSQQPTSASQDRWSVPQGELFLMGDHRGDSADSRAFGSVAVGQVVGRAWLRYWPIEVFQILPTPTYATASSGTP